MSFPINDHTHVSVEIVVCLLGWELPLCCKALGKLLEEHFCFPPMNKLTETMNGVNCFHWKNQVSSYLLLLSFYFVYSTVSSEREMSYICMSL